MTAVPSSLMTADTSSEQWIKGWSVDPLDGPHGDLIRQARAEESARRLAVALELEASR